MSKTKLKAHEFLAVAHDYSLGELVTEMAHPETEQLSQLAQNDPQQALRILKQLDLKLFDTLSSQLELLDTFHHSIFETLEHGDRVYLCGCGATGRLALTIETLWRQKYKSHPLEDKVIGFMAGGDVALISSIEKFEDYPEYGARQLNDLKFGPGDLFVGITEGGETPFVIGATEEATQISKRKPFFLYCNPDEALLKVARSKAVLRNDKINKINLTVGPMALSGSTRMQATSVQMMALIIAIFSDRKDSKGRAHLLNSW